MTKIPLRNPILPGFNPDPSICRVENDFWIATSTFEWFPGVQIYHSNDLRHWKLVHRPLNEERLLSMRGIPSSGGIWAPCLTHREGTFYLVYTVVQQWRGETPVDWGAFKDTPNFVVTAPSIEGPWSDPVYLNSSGFDPSLFHDDDGKSWLVNMEWDYRNRPTYFSGILLQEYDRERRALVGPIRKIYTGTSIGFTEGPHVYKRGGYYYLMTAEGGTSYEHAVSVARSRSLFGPYEDHPNSPLCTSLTDRSAARDPLDFEARSLRPKDLGRLPPDFYTAIQKSGHGSYAPLSDDEGVLVHLCARPVAPSIACPLGRETAIQRVLWRDDWPFVVDADGKTTNRAPTYPAVSFDSATTRRAIPEARYASDLARGQRLDWSFIDEFDADAWHVEFRTLRGPLGADADLKSRPGWLRLYGRQSPTSTFYQSILATSVKHERFEARTVLEFRSEHVQQMAGLLVRYDERNQYYLHQVFDPDLQANVVSVLSFVGGVLTVGPSAGAIVVPEGPLEMLARVDGLSLRFSAGRVGAELVPVGGEYDVAPLSDEGAWPMGFTGLFVGVACHDLTGRRAYADFDRFCYEERH